MQFHILAKAKEKPVQDARASFIESDNPQFVLSPLIKN